MESVRRQPYQGVINIIRFNWHFYVVAAVVVITLSVVTVLTDGLMFQAGVFIIMGVLLTTCISLLVSHYVYDRSGLYELEWLSRFENSGTQRIVNIHAGFDETSIILKRKFPQSDLRVFDFYDPGKHTELSIERARKAYAPFEGTVAVTTSSLPLAARSADIIFNIFALHEIRDRKERIQFLKEQLAALRDDGKIVLVEHLRDLSNFLAYNVGFFHFLSEDEWRNNFQHAGLLVDKTFKTTPFISVFILKKA